MYNRFGPTLRICFNFFKDNEILSVHEGHYENALRELSSKKLRDMVSEACEFKMDAVSRTILLVKRVDVSGRTGWIRASLEPITHVVKMALRNRLEKESRDEQLKLYNYLIDVEGTRRVAGFLDESLTLLKLRRLSLILFGDKKVGLDLAKYRI